MSHVFGSGYNSARQCQFCRHGELEHFGGCVKCKCAGFAGRKLTKAERKVMREQQAVKPEGVSYGGEGWLNDFMHDWNKKIIPGVDD